VSIKATVWAWDVPDLGPAELLVLLAIADVVLDDGSCYAPIAALAKRARQSGRSVQRHLLTLEERRLIVRVDREGRTNALKLNIEGDER
jgi:RIO-like serine/threonine protein kinase